MYVIFCSSFLAPLLNSFTFWICLPVINGFTYTAINSSVLILFLIGTTRLLIRGHEWSWHIRLGIRGSGVRTPAAPGNLWPWVAKKITSDSQPKNSVPFMKRKFARRTLTDKKKSSKYQKCHCLLLEHFCYYHQYCKTFKQIEATALNHRYFVNIIQEKN